MLHKKKARITILVISTNNYEILHKFHQDETFTKNFLSYMFYDAFNTEFLKDEICIIPYTMVFFFVLPNLLIGYFDVFVRVKPRNLFQLESEKFYKVGQTDRYYICCPL